MHTIGLRTRSTLFGLLAATCLLALGCGPTSSPDCSTPFSGVAGYDYFFPHSNATATPDGQMAIHYWTEDPKAGSAADHVSWARLWDGNQWTSQRLAAGDTIYWGVYFARQGNRWHTAESLHVDGIWEGRTRTVYQHQTADGSFSAPQFVTSGKSDGISDGGLAVSTDGKVAISEELGTDENGVMLFSEKPAIETAAFANETVKLGGTPVVGRSYFTGYDQAQNPLILYLTPITMAGLYRPIQIRLLRKINGIWNDHLVLDLGAVVAPNSLSANITSDGMLLMTFGSSPVKLGVISIEGMTYDLKTDQPGAERVLTTIAPEQDIDLFDVYTRVVLGANGTDALSMISLVHTPNSLYFTTSYSPSTGFGTAQPWSKPGQYGWTAGPMFNACDGPRVLIIPLGTGTKDEPWPLRLVPFSN